MGRTISVRLDDDADGALEELAADGSTPSEVVRRALLEAVKARRRVALRAEVERLAEDPQDRAAKAELAAFMESLG